MICKSVEYNKFVFGLNDETRHNTENITKFLLLRMFFSVIFKWLFYASTAVKWWSINSKQLGLNKWEIEYIVIVCYLYLVSCTFQCLEAMEQRLL